MVPCSHLCCDGRCSTVGRSLPPGTSARSGVRTVSGSALLSLFYRSPFVLSSPGALVPARFRPPVLGCSRGPRASPPAGVGRSGVWPGVAGRAVQPARGCMPFVPSLALGRLGGWVRPWNIRLDVVVPCLRPARSTRLRGRGSMELPARWSLPPSLVGRFRRLATREAFSCLVEGLPRPTRISGLCSEPHHTSVFLPESPGLCVYTTTTTNMTPTWPQHDPHLTPS